MRTGVCVFLLSVSVWACVLCATGAESTEPAAWPASADTLAALLDPVFAREMERQDVPGAVCAVVGDGRVLFCKGYGVENLETHRPVDGARTLFRLASISKLFAATSVMQLYEQGRLDLRADVNTYLRDFQLPATFPTPVTLENLLTHTGGFDDRFLGAGAPLDSAPETLGAYLARRMPPRVMPPGLYYSYSNHGMALAGHIVESVSGLSFSQYAQQHIFDLLGMTHSSFDLRPDLLPDLATGYSELWGVRAAEPLDYALTIPASMLMSTGADMAKFMLAHLALGAAGANRILEKDTARLMQTQHFSQHPGLPGWAYGFEERHQNGLHLLEHGGLIWGFSSLLMLSPEHDFGFFVSLNRQGCDLDNIAFSAFLNRFFPWEAPHAPKPIMGPEAVWNRDLEGYYRHNRYVRSDFFKLATVAAEYIREVHVQAAEEPGYLTLAFLDSFGRCAAPWRLVETEPGLFCRVDKRGSADQADWRLTDRGRVAFALDESGKTTHLFINGNTYERLAWYESRPCLLGLLGASLAVLVLGFIVWPVAAWLRRRRGRAPHPSLIRWLGWGIWATVTWLVVFVAVFGVVLRTLDPHTLGYCVPITFKLLLSMCLCIMVFFIMILPALVIAWWRRAGPAWLRSLLTLEILALSIVLWWLGYWNLLGFQFG